MPRNLQWPAAADTLPRSRLGNHEPVIDNSVRHVPLASSTAPGPCLDVSGNRHRIRAITKTHRREQCLVYINSFDAATRRERITGETFWQLHDGSQTLDGVAAFGQLLGDASSIAGHTDEFPITFATADAFRILHLAPVVGRLWTPDEEARGETDIAVLGYRFWQRDLGGRPDVLGLTITRGARSYRVIGVLSAASDHPGIAFLGSPIWLPAVVRPNTAGRISILARVRSDRTRAMVADELRTLAAAPQWTPVISGPLDAERERVGRWMRLALGASGLLVLLGCINAGNLMLSRSAERSRELAVRALAHRSRYVEYRDGRRPRQARASDAAREGQHLDLVWSEAVIGRLTWSVWTEFALLLSFCRSPEPRSDQ